MVALFTLKGIKVNLCQKKKEVSSGMLKCLCLFILPLGTPRIWMCSHRLIKVILFVIILTSYSYNNNESACYAIKVIS